MSMTARAEHQLWQQVVHPATLTCNPSIHDKICSSVSSTVMSQIENMYREIWINVNRQVRINIENFLVNKPDQDKNPIMVVIL
jgi:hypothetical protein